MTASVSGPDRRCDVAIVGAGILGLSHAYHLARQGQGVVVFERSGRAVGASVRNFGMLWPIGQTAGPMRAMALRARSHWLDVLDAAGLWHDPCGSLHLAYHDDEATVLREFVESTDTTGLDLELIDPRAIARLAPAVKQQGLQLGLFSKTEVNIDPRQVIAELPGWLASRFGVRFRFGTAVTAYDRPRVTAGGETWHADSLIICSGNDLSTLFPGALGALGLAPCKLQMMRTPPAPDGWKLGPMLAAGLTLRHYRAFEGCPTLPSLRDRFAREGPEFDRHGIHVMASRSRLGEVVLGDSHEHGPAIEPFDKDEIDAAVLRYLSTFLEIRPMTIAERWHGVYLKHPERPFTVAHPGDGVTAVLGLGGAGMTLSFGLAEQVVGSLRDAGGRS
jgi:FAD dependent oxidoreductase TIGR03364